MSASLRPFLLAAVLCAGPALSASATEEQTTSVTFSDPARPGTLRVQLARGDLRIQGADTTAVTVRSSARATDRQPRKDGLRVLAAASGYTLTEKDNVAVLDGNHPLAGEHLNFEVEITEIREATQEELEHGHVHGPGGHHH